MMQTKEWGNMASNYGDAGNDEIMKFLNSTVYLEKKFAGDKTAISKRIEELKNYNPSKLYELNVEYFAVAGNKLPKMEYAISRFNIGLPFVTDPARDKKYNDTRAPDMDQYKAFVKDIMKTFREDNDKFNENADTQMQVDVDSFVVTIDEFLALVMADGLKAFISMTFVFCYLNVHLQSCWLSCVGMGIIILSFPFTAIITNGILQIKYFGFL